MSTIVTMRVERLKIDVRLVILETIRSLRVQRNAARKKKQFDIAAEIQEQVEKLLDQLDVMSGIALRLVENSPEVKKVINDLRKATEELEDEADKITDITNALTKGAEILSKVEKGVKIVTSLAGV